MKDPGYDFDDGAKWATGGAEQASAPPRDRELEDARERSVIINHELEQARDGIDLAEQRSGVLVLECKRLLSLVNASTSERERDLLGQVAALKKKSAEQQKRIGALASALESAQRHVGRFQQLYDGLCQRADMPIPPCDHGNNPSRCITCVANWLGREAIPPPQHAARGKDRG